nr:hypothetical protein [Rhodococcus sp. ACPA4]
MDGIVVALIHPDACEKGDWGLEETPSFEHSRNVAEVRKLAVRSYQVNWHDARSDVGAAPCALTRSDRDDVGVRECPNRFPHRLPAQPEAFGKRTF